MTVKTSTIRKLYAVSRNQCAFPDCNEVIFDMKYDSIVGQAAHIRAQNDGGPRFIPDYPDVDDYDNLVLFCSKHHKIVDDNVDEFTVEVLTVMKSKHEQAAEPIEEPDDQFAEKILRASGLAVDINNSTVGNIFNVQSSKQSGGITAGIVNQGVQPRRLEANEKNQLIQTLKKMPPIDCELASIMDGEAAAFWQELSILLKSCGWTLNEYQAMYVPTPQRVIIESPAATQEQVLPQIIAVALALSKSKIHVTLRYKAKVTDPKIIIGGNV